MANCEEPPMERVQTEASWDGSLRKEKGTKGGVSAEAGFRPRNRGATRPVADQAAAPRPFPRYGQARGGERAG